MKTYIGVDLGGTNVRAALVDDNGAILEMKKTSTEIHLGTAHVMNKIIELIKSLDGYEKASGIGLGVPGPVDTLAIGIERIVVAEGHHVRLNLKAQTKAQDFRARLERGEEHEVERHHQEDRSDDEEDADDDRAGIYLNLLSHHASSFLKKPMSSSWIMFTPNTSSSSVIPMAEARPMLFLVIPIMYM